MVSRRFLLLLVFVLAAVSELHAQLRVDMTLPRRLYMAYEPMLATVSITNYTGREISLENLEGESWLSFQVTNAEGTLVAPRQGKSRFDPRLLGPGESTRFSVNLVNSFPITEFGSYRIRASIYFADMNKFFSSPARVVEVSEGKVIWEQNLGVPEREEGAGGQRHVTLLTFRNADENNLYVRVEDPKEGVVYMTQKMGRLISQTVPQIEVDPNNKLHLMQLVGPKTYLYSCVSLNGEPVTHGTYYETKTRPKLRRLPNGNVGVAGGQAASPSSPVEQGDLPPRPKISDRPVELPAK